MCITVISGYYVLLVLSEKSCYQLPAFTYSYSYISHTGYNQTLTEGRRLQKKNVDLLVLQFILTQSRWGGENKWQMKSHPSRLQLQTSKSKKSHLPGTATWRQRPFHPGWLVMVEISVLTLILSNVMVSNIVPVWVNITVSLNLFWRTFTVL